MEFSFSLYTLRGQEAKMVHEMSDLQNLLQLKSLSKQAWVQRTVQQQICMAAAPFRSQERTQLEVCFFVRLIYTVYIRALLHIKHSCGVELVFIHQPSSSHQRNQ
jgi:hypothetical protein